MAMTEAEIPPEFFREMCEDSDQPQACVSLRNTFVWVNSAYEKLVGYSSAGLQGKTWMSITAQKDVGEDLAATELVIQGKTDEYRMDKDYIHKRGHLVPVEHRVKRFPSSPLEELLCFRVEASPAKATRPELDSMYEELTKQIGECRKIIMEKNNINGSFNQTSTNSDKTIRWLIIGAVSMFLFGAWILYYVSMGSRPDINPVPPPSIEIPKT